MKSEKSEEGEERMVRREMMESRRNKDKGSK